MPTTLELLILQADVNLHNLSLNPYQGRGLVIGTTEDDKHIVQVYWIMGRRENSRNRVFESENGRLYTVAADPSKVEDPSLIIYNAMDEVKNCHVVSNGNQTDTVSRSLRMGMDFYHTMLDVKYEPDPPIYTPRITAVCWNPRRFIPHGIICINRKSPFDYTCQITLLRYDALPTGLGYCVTTYSGDGNPPPSFVGEPYLVPLRGSINDIMLAFWRVLDVENRVSLAVKFIPRDGGPSYITYINKYKKVGA